MAGYNYPHRPAIKKAESMSESTEQIIDERRLATAGLGEALRRLNRASCETKVPDEVLDEVRAAAEQLTLLLDTNVRARNEVALVDDVAANVRYFSPVRGLGSPASPPLVFTTQPDGGVVATGSFDVRFEGPPAHVHGGIIALVFDEVLGQPPIDADRWGMTASLSVNYHHPSPLHTELRFEAKITEQVGRKTIVSGWLTTAEDPETVLASAEGLFIAPRQEHYEARFGSLVTENGQAASVWRLIS
ncbi:PaaI family thioesterase [Pseudarthrobacter sp. NIBRBAC000502772]|uniref:PaaI family thioesterase n=1 Tax=Pseudarthrobacter sp. NIBRBAC000502772 TaxID=2590775 RepID=UPI001131A286|nr:PaaI family thioesterase [Pseudarthrobacter sp. NIBRBAC000502772]QDG66697.1 PaaI family thioesterase [Pseudarthrobacter sp. NIBRBAC000502772]